MFVIGIRIVLAVFVFVLVFISVFVAVFVFVFLFGMLMIRGKARQVKDDEQRKTQAAQVLYNRMMSDQDVVQQRRIELGYDATPLPPKLK